MLGTTRSRRSPLHSGKFGKKPPEPLTKKCIKNNNLGSVVRPRRFSLLYSSDSSTSGESDVGGKNLKFKEKHKKGSVKAKSISSNAEGKTSKLIRHPSRIRRDYAASGKRVFTSEQDISIEEEENTDDDDSESDSGSNYTSSSEEDIDFVKLQAQRKKRSMMALSALKRDGSNLAGQTNSQKLDAERPDEKRTGLTPAAPKSRLPPTGECSANQEIMGVDDLSSRKKVNVGRIGKSVDKNVEEDVGEEVQDPAGTIKDDYCVGLYPDDDLNQLLVPHLSDSEDSEYNIDQDAYFNAIEDENDLIGIENSLDPNADEDGNVLHAEEHMISALRNDDSVSFEGSVRESGSDPTETISISAAGQSKCKLVNGDESDDQDNDSDDSDDEIMTVFDMPFYEDPKFASLYYCEDGNEPRLSLSTSLPLLMSDEKMMRKKRKEARKMARKERMQRRRQTKQERSRIEKSRINTEYSDEEFMFGIFFNNDRDDIENGFNDKNCEFKKKLDFESPLRRLEYAADSGISTDEEYDNILMDIANLSSSDESNNGKIIKDREFHMGDNTKFDESSGGLEVEFDDPDDELQEDSSVTNVFIDIDDLDPDSFYFHYSENDVSTSYSEMMTDDTDIDEQARGEKNKDDAMETITYTNDESTDEDDNLPPPGSRIKNIGTKAKEVVSANVVGLKPPRLGTWETDSKPFTIIDGLSTKSLYPLIQEHQHLLEQQQKAQSQSPEYHSSNEATSLNGDELTLNELLNMSELEDDDVMPSYSQAFSDWYRKPSVPLSAFRNKGINLREDDEFLLSINSTKKVPIGYVGSERTRRKIDKVKELQRKKSEKKRKLKKRKKLLKLKRERDRIDKQNRIQDLNTGPFGNKSSLGFPNSSLVLDQPLKDIPDETEEGSCKNSFKSVGLAEIHEILLNDNTDILEDNSFVENHAEEVTTAGISDADILASLTAPVDISDVNHRPSRRCRQSMVEAAAENLRFTKNGLFSETALADIEGFFNGSGVTSNTFEFNETLQ